MPTDYRLRGISVDEGHLQTTKHYFLSGGDCEVDLGEVYVSSEGLGRGSFDPLVRSAALRMLKELESIVGSNGTIESEARELPIHDGTDIASLIASIERWDVEKPRCAESHNTIN